MKLQTILRFALFFKLLIFSNFSLSASLPLLQEFAHHDSFWHTRDLSQGQQGIYDIQFVCRGSLYTVSFSKGHPEGQFWDREDRGRLKPRAVLSEIKQDDGMKLYRKNTEEYNKLIKEIITKAQEIFKREQAHFLWQ